MTMTKRTILVLDDDETEIDLLREAMAEASCFDDTRIDSANCVDAGMDHLRSEVRETGRVVTDLCLVDLDLPGQDGLEFVRRVRADPDLKTVPMILFTSRRCMETMVRAYETGASSFVNKPTAFADCVALMRCLHRFWLDFALVPAQRGAI
jgi:CheY-like chemotaxis protein